MGRGFCRFTAGSPAQICTGFFIGKCTLHGHDVQKRFPASLFTKMMKPPSIAGRLFVVFRIISREAVEI